MKESIKHILQMGGILSYPYQDDKEDYIVNIEIFILPGAFTDPSWRFIDGIGKYSKVEYKEPRIVLNGPKMRQDWPLGEIDTAIEGYLGFVNNPANLAKKESIQPNKLSSKYRVEFAGPYPVSDTEQEYIGVIKEFKIVETGKTKQEAFDQCLISLNVLFAYNSGMKLNLYKSE